MRNNLNLHPHVIFAQPWHSNTGPNRAMIRHPLLEIPHHGLQCLVVDGDMIRVDSEDLFPAFAAGVLQVALNILEGLVDLSIDFAVELEGLGVPAAC